MDSTGRQSFEFGDFRLDRHRRTLHDAGGTQTGITAKAFDTLVYFLEHPGVPIQRSRLLDELWPGTVVEDNNLNQTVAALRRVLGDGYIVTIRGRGYQFAADVRAVPVVPAESVAPRAGIFGLPKVVVYASIGGLVLAGTLATVLAVVAIDNAGAGRGELPKIAVLPCDNLSPDPDDAYVALSVHDEMLTRLGKMRGLRIVSRSSVMQYADRRPPIPEIANELNADAVMECTVRYSGTDIVASMKLIDAGTDTQLWAETYRGGWNDLGVLVAMHADIAMRTADALGVDYRAAERQRIEQPPTSSREAYAHFLEARQVLAERGHAMGYSAAEFYDHVNRAIDADPDFAAAYAQRGFWHLNQVTDALRDTRTAPDSAVARATLDRELESAGRDAARAIELDPALGEAHALAGAVQRILGNERLAQAHFEAAVELGPNQAEILAFVAGNFYLRDGRRAEALALLEQVERLNPIDLDLAYFFYLAGDRKTGTEILERAVARNPAHPLAHLYLGYSAATGGNATVAEAELRLAEELLLNSEDGALALHRAGTMSTLAYAYGRIALEDDVRRFVQKFMDIVEQTPAAPIDWVMIQLAMGDVEAAYDWASVVAEGPLPPFISSELEFVLNAYNDPILEQPQWVALRRKLASWELP